MFTLPVVTVLGLRFIVDLAVPGLYGPQSGLTVMGMLAAMITMYSVLLAETGQMFALSMPHSSVASKVFWQLLIAVISLLIIGMSMIPYFMTDYNGWIALLTLSIPAALALIAARATRRPDKALWDRL